MALRRSKTSADVRGFVYSGACLSVGDPDETPGGENAFCCDSCSLASSHKIRKQLTQSDDSAPTLAYESILVST